MAAPTREQWSHIHARAWKDDKFRALLESNPSAALELYGKDNDQVFDKVIDIGPRPEGVSDEELHKHHNIPPACC